MSKKGMRRLSYIFFIVILLTMVYAYFFSPWGPEELTSGGRLAPPSAEHPLGTDHLSRDILTRLGQGASGTLIVAAGTVAFGGFFGFLLGALAGYLGGAFDWWVSRIIDALLAFPAILMGLLFSTAFGRGIPQLVLSLGIAFVPSFARIARSGYREQRSRDFVKRLEVMGTPPLRIIFVHMAPLLKEQYLNAVTIGLANAILAESGMSFIGFGVQAPRPSWGSMLSDAGSYIFQAPWAALFPGLYIVMTVLAVFLLGRSFDFRHLEEGDYR